MKTSRRFALGSLLALLALPALAAGPQRNLLVELRWVESSVSGAVLGGVRAGAVVVGTAGSVSPKPGPGPTLSTQNRAEDGQAIQRLLVLNGRSGSVALSEQQPVQWLDYGVELPAGGRGQATVYAAPRTSLVERSRGFVVTPQWPGGTQPVQVELKAMASQADGQAQLYSTVQVGLGDWITVARSGAPAQRPEPGVLSSRDAEPQSSRELQLRVSLAP